MKDKLIHAVTEYDRKQSTKRRYNWNALALYFRAIDDAADLVAKGKTWADAITIVFNDRLRDYLLKVIERE